MSLINCFMVSTVLETWVCLALFLHEQYYDLNVERTIEADDSGTLLPTSH